MPTLSSQYAYITLADGTRVDPISVSVTVSENWSPYCQATVEVPKDAIALSDIDPTQGDRLILTLQQDFGDLIYNYELTDDFGGDVSAITAAYGGDVSDITRAYTKPWNIFEQGLPISTVTAAYGGDVSNLTAAELMEVWRMSDFLHSEGTFNPAPSTVFRGDLGVRQIVEDYIAQTVTISLSSDEAYAQDKYGWGISDSGTYTSLRELTAQLLKNVNLGITYPGDSEVTLAPGSDVTLTEPYVISTDFWLSLSYNLWDILITVANSVGWTIWCDENRTWHLEPTTITAGSLELKDDDNITAFSRTRSREGNWYDGVHIEYADGYDLYSETVGNWFPTKQLYLDRKETVLTDNNAAQTITARALTRGDTYELEAISNYDARPRQSVTVDITDMPIVSGVVESITWSLPSARMSVELRDLEEV